VAAEQYTQLEKEQHETAAPKTPTPTMFRSAGRALRQSRSLRPRAMQSAIRPLSYGAAHMSGSLTPVEPPLPSAQATDSFQLLSTEEKASAEDDIFNAQVQQVKDCWASPRYEGIKRPYSAETVVSKRGSLQQVYPSSLMARKLFNLLEERAKEGKPVHTSTYTNETEKNCMEKFAYTFVSQWVPLTPCR
jgi:isocitrate lyase